MLPNDVLYIYADPNDYSPRTINVTFPSGSVEGQIACSNFLILNDLIVEITETFRVTLTTNDPDVTIGNCDGIGVPSFTIYIKGNNSKNLQALCCVLPLE